MSYKGKEIAGKESSSKRKRDDDGNSVRRRRKNSTVLQFFEDAADVGNDSSDSSISGDDFLDEEFATGLEVKNEPGKAHYLPFLPKEEELSEEEIENMVTERYKDGSKFVTYAEDDYETKRSIQRNTLMISVKDPNIWKVKCKVGQERLSAFCLMQKYVDLQSLGTKLQIISAFAVEHVKGAIYIEADKQCDINEACKNLCGIYASRVVSVPNNEITHLLSAQSKCNEIPEGSWARVKNGKYKGDLAQIVVVNDAQKKATVRLIPRIDLQALAEKFGGGGSAKKGNSPAPRLISSSELEEFRPLIQYRRDRDTGKFFEILDGQMLKDGYLYKKVSIDSLSCWGVTPSEEELQKFSTSTNGELVDLEWLSQLYGEQKQKRPRKNDKGGEKGGGSSGSSLANSFDLHDLVCFGRKDFGIVIGMEKDDNYKILKDGSEGPVVQTVDLHELKNPLFENKFTALDQHMKPISINDTLKVLEGPLKDRQGLVKKIYRGVIFLYDENEMENNGYFCSKSQMCEKIKVYGDASNEKGGASGPSGFEDFNSSPKSPLSPKKPWVARENNCGFNREDKEGIFSVGQKLRIRVGPLKGYLCRVLAIRYSDVTVKLDSQHKVLTVKTEHLSEVHGKGFSTSTSDNPESTFGLLGTQDSVGGWVNEAGTSAKNDSWNTGETSAVRSSWPSFPASDFSLHQESNCANPFSSMDNDPKKDMGDTSWEIKSTSNQNSSWGTASTSTAVSDNDQVEGWGKKENSWNKSTATTGFGGSVADGWEKAKLSNVDQAGPSKGAGDSWGDKVAASDQGGSRGKGETCWDKSAATTSIGIGATDNWGNAKPSIGGQTGSSKDDGTNWDNKTAADGDQVGGWGKSDNCWKVTDGDDGSTWGKALVSQEKGTGSSASKMEWNSTTARTENQTGGWSSTGGGWAQQEGVGEDASGWRKGGSSNQDQTGNWNKPKTFGATGGIAWNQQADEITEKAGSDQNGSWGKLNSFGGDREFGRGNGSGGRRGRDQFGRGRSFGHGQSSDWNKEGEENTWTGDGAPSGSQSGWSHDQALGWGRGKSFDESGKDVGWKKESASHEDNGSSWSKKWGGGKETSEIGVKGSNSKPFGWNSDLAGSQDQNNNWNTSKASIDDQGSGWKSGTDRASKDQSGWGNKDQSSSWSKGKSSIENQGTCWKSGTNNTGGNGWKNKSLNNEKDGGEKDQGDGWNSGKTSDGSSASLWGQNSGWQTGINSERGNQDSDWGKKGNWNTGGNRDSDWGKKGNWNTRGNQDSDWGKKSNWNSGGGNENRNDTSDSRERGGNWNSGANQDADWGKRSNWNSGGGNEYQNDASDSRERGGNWRGGRGGSGRGGFGGRGGSDGGGFGGRGGSDRGGFGGIGGSDRGGFGGRGGSDRGGFRGRGRSDRGGFGGRGRGRSDREAFHGGGDSDRGGFGGRGGYQGGGYSDTGGFGGRGRGRMDQSGGWNNRNDSGEDSKHLEWNKESNDNNNEGWKGHDGAGSWGRGGGGDKGKWQSWDSGTGNKSKGWNSEGSGWNQSKGKANGGSSTEATDLNSQGGGWNKGWSAHTSGADEGNTWKQSSASGGVGQWSAGKESTTSVGQGEAWGKQGSSGWNRGQSSSGSGGMKRDGGQPSSAWNQTNNTKEEGTSNTGEATTDSWGVKAAAEKCWDKEKDGGSMW